MDLVVPDWFWFWFSLLLLLWFTLSVAPSQSTLSTLTCLGHHTITIAALETGLKRNAGLVCLQEPYVG